MDTTTSAPVTAVPTSIATSTAASAPTSIATSTVAAPAATSIPPTSIATSTAPPAATSTATSTAATFGVLADSQSNKTDQNNQSLALSHVLKKLSLFAVSPKNPAVLHFLKAIQSRFVFWFISPGPFGF
jgi:hypothetical protein